MPVYLRYHVDRRRVEGGFVRRHLKLLLADAYGRKVWQLTRFEAHSLDDTVYPVKAIEKSPVWKIKVFVGIVDRYDHPISVATIALLDCCVGITGDGTFR